MSKIFKSKFYICKIEGNKRIVMPRFGAFSTDSKAFDFMFRPASKEQQDDPRFIKMERKPEFENFTTAKGERILKNPKVWIVEDLQ